MNNKLKLSLTQLAKTLEKHNIHANYDTHFYPVNVNNPYLAIGYYDKEKFEKLNNKLNKFIYHKNRQLSKLIRRHLREFYKMRKGVKSSNKIMLVESPEDTYNIKLVNRGFKMINPFMFQEKVSQGDKKFINKINKKITGFKHEFETFHKYLLSLMKVNQKKLYQKVKSDYSSDIVSKVGVALISISDNDTTILKTYNVYPFLELKTLPTDKHFSSLKTLIHIHQNKNSRECKKLVKLARGSRMVVGLPHISNESSPWMEHLGICAIYSTFGDENAIETLQAFISKLHT